MKRLQIQDLFKMFEPGIEGRKLDQKLVINKLENLKSKECYINC